MLKFPVVSRFNRRWNNSRFQSNRHRPQSSINVSFKERNPFAESSSQNHESRGPTLANLTLPTNGRVERQTSPLVPLRVFPIYAPRIRGQRNEVLNQRTLPNWTSFAIKFRAPPNVFYMLSLTISSNMNIHEYNRNIKKNCVRYRAIVLLYQQLVQIYMTLYSYQLRIKIVTNKKYFFLIIKLISLIILHVSQRILAEC